MRGRRFGIAMLAVVGLLAGCGGGGSSGATMAVSTAGSAGSEAAVAMSSNADLEATDSVTTTGPTVTVPVTTVTKSDGSSLVTVQISVGGGAPATVQLDTGSSGLLINSSVVGSQVTNTGQQLDEGFVSGTVAATLAQAPVTIGGVTTSGPIGIGLVQVGSGPNPFDTTDGILGIATANGPTLDPTLFTPSLQLPAPYSSGIVLDIAQNGAGTWTLGPVTEGAGSISLPFNEVSGSPSSYPNGAAGFAKDFTLCWTIGSNASSCGPTDFDLGNPTPALNSTTFSSLGASGQSLAAGTSIAMADPAQQELWSFTTGETPGENLVVLAELGSATEFNTGIGYFFQNVISFDYPNSRVLVTPKG